MYWGSRGKCWQPYSKGWTGSTGVHLEINDASLLYHIFFCTSWIEFAFIYVHFSDRQRCSWRCNYIANSCYKQPTVQRYNSLKANCLRTLYFSNLYVRNPDFVNGYTNCREAGQRSSSQSYLLGIWGDNRACNLLNWWSFSLLSDFDLVTWQFSLCYLWNGLFEDKFYFTFC